MRRGLLVLGAWCLVLGGFAEQYVLPGRADLDTYHFDKTSLPYSTWTNTAQWLVDETRVDFSPDHADVPDVVEVNCLRIPADGSSVSTSGIVASNKSYAIQVDFNLSDFDDTADKQALFGSGTRSYVYDCVLIRYSTSTQIRVYWRGGHSIYHGDPSFYIANPTSPNFWIVLRKNMDANTQSCRMDDYFVTKSNVDYPLVLETSVTDLCKINIGGWVANLNSSICQYKEWNRALTDLEMADALIGGTPAGVVKHFVFEGSGSVAYNVETNAYHGAIVGGTWTNSPFLVGNWALDHGYRQDGVSKIPALADGSAAADGNPITHPGGYVHNGAACSLVLADGSTNTYAQLLAMPGIKTNANGAITSLYLTN